MGNVFKKSPVPKSQISGKTNRKKYQEKQLKTISGEFYDQVQHFRLIPLNPKLEQLSICGYNAKVKEIIHHRIQSENTNSFEATDDFDDTFQTFNVDDSQPDLFETAQLSLDNDDNKPQVDDMDNVILSGSTNIDGLMNLFFQAYAHHGTVFIRPEDIWFHILQQIGVMIDANPEKFRNNFVSHQGKKTISADVDCYNKENTKVFIKTICEKIQHETKNDLINIFQPKFSSTTEFDTTLNGIASMTNLRHYFDYCVEVSCGIRNLSMAGELNDWINLKENVNKLKVFGKEISQFAAGILPILDEFIQAYKGCPDVGFFNRIFREDAQMVGEFELGYGMGSIFQYITGWILNFYHDGIQNKNTKLPRHFRSKMSCCPFTLNKFGSSVQKNLYASCLGIKYHATYDAYSLVKGWWSADAIQNSK